MNYYKFKIIEEETPGRAEREMDDYINHCNRSGIEILEITNHVTVNAECCYTYTFILKVSTLQRN